MLRRRTAIGRVPAGRQQPAPRQNAKVVQGRADASEGQPPPVAVPAQTLVELQFPLSVQLPGTESEWAEPLTRPSGVIAPDTWLSPTEKSNRPWSSTRKPPCDGAPFTEKEFQEPFQREFPGNSIPQPETTMQAAITTMNLMSNLLHERASN